MGSGVPNIRTRMQKHAPYQPKSSYNRHNALNNGGMPKNNLEAYEKLMNDMARAMHLHQNMLEKQRENAKKIKAIQRAKARMVRENNALNNAAKRLKARIVRQKLKASRPGLFRKRNKNKTNNALAAAAGMNF